jgi:hypothetical protein
LLRRAPPAQPSYLETHYVYFEILLRGDLPLQTLKCGTIEFLDFPALETRKMKMVLLCLDLVVVFLTVEVHQVELIDQPHALEQLKRPVDGGTINLGVPLASSRQQGCSVKVGICKLNGFDQRASLRGQTNASGFYLIEQITALQHRLLVATHSQLLQYTTLLVRLQPSVNCLFWAGLLDLSAIYDSFSPSYNPAV